MKISLGGENRAGKSAGNHDDQLREQTDLDDLAQEQFPTQPCVKTERKRFGREQNELTEIDEESEDAGADAR